MRVAFFIWLPASSTGLAAQVAHHLFGLVLDDHPIEQRLDDAAVFVRHTKKP
jgi:hypothetical protein